MAMQRRATRITAIVLGIIVLIAAVGIGAIQWASQEIRQRIVEVLGPNGSAEHIDVGLYTVHLDKVRMGGPPDWPAPDSLRADSIDIVPDWPAWFSHRLHLKSVDIHHFYQSAERTPDGQLIVLPGLKQNVTQMEQAHAAEHESGGGSPPPLDVQVDQINFHDGQFDFFDGKVAKPPYAIRLDQFNATVGSLNFPALSNPSTLRITATMGGGTLALDGWIRFDTRDSHFTLAMAGVDAKTMQPYLLRGQKTVISAGTVDLNLDWTVSGYQLHAPGKLSLSNLDIAPQSDGPLGALASVPKKAAVEALKNDQGRIDINFELNGDLRDPKFSLDEDWYKRVGAGMAKVAGVTVENVGRTAGDTAKGIGNTLKSLIGQ